MPVSEADIGATLIAAFKLVEEKSELRLGWESSAFDLSILGKIVIGREERPILRDLHGYGSIERPNLQIQLESETGIDAQILSTWI